MARTVEIVCSACGAEALLKREPVYEGFKKTGEVLSCSACGHRYQNEEAVPFRQAVKPGLFNDADRSAAPPPVLGDARQIRNCRHCRHYVRNPFTQRCGLHHREVQATDHCGDFETPEDSGPGDADTRGSGGS